MPIPAFDSLLNVLPPHLGNPNHRKDVSPYHCSVMELCERYGTSGPRRHLLTGFLDFREVLFDLELVGFQWLDGSFVEDVEAQEQRDPDDLDLVTWVDRPKKPEKVEKLINSEILKRAVVRRKYGLDHLLVPLNAKPVVLVNQSKYWYALFSHRRDGLWKGMLQVDLTDPQDDAEARKFLGASP